jgi:hypothetical protein
MFLDAFDLVRGQQRIRWSWRLTLNVLLPAIDDDESHEDEKAHEQWNNKPCHTHSSPNVEDFRQEDISWSQVLSVSLRMVQK